MEAQNHSTTHDLPHSDIILSPSEEKLKIIVEDDFKPADCNGEPIITTGRDISRFVVDIRDDEDPALTFRSIFLGTLVAGLGATLGQVRIPGRQHSCCCCHQIQPLSH